ncbi:hypothetical protein GCM10027180_18840 [Microbulbifer echini]
MGWLLVKSGPQNYLLSIFQTTLFRLKLTVSALPEEISPCHVCDQIGLEFLYTVTVISESDEVEEKR